MTNYKKKLIIGSRASQLAMAQTNDFIDKVLEAYPDMEREAIEIKTIKTSGDLNQTSRLDQLGGKGLFAKEIETEILNGKIDVGIHSMKDMPAKENEDLMIGCWLKRMDSRDVMVSLSKTSFSNLKQNAIVGTSSIRRRSQVLSIRTDLRIHSLRGNVDTRIKKLNDLKYDAIILSMAGLQRLSSNHLITYTFPIDEILPAACQGAVGVQLLSSNNNLKSFLKPLNHDPTEQRCRAERGVLRLINANCNSPIGMLAELDDDKLLIRCDIFDHDGNKLYTNTIKNFLSKSNDIIQEMGEDILSSLGQNTIDNLDKLNNDFNYTPK